MKPDRYVGVPLGLKHCYDPEGLRYIILSQYFVSLQTICYTMNFYHNCHFDTIHRNLGDKICFIDPIKVI